METNRPENYVETIEALKAKEDLQKIKLEEQNALEKLRVSFV